MEEMSLGEGKEFFGGRCVLGGFDNRKSGVLYSGSREEIEAETEKLVKEAGVKGVMIGADCSLPSDIATERFKWVRAKLDAMA